MNRNTTSTIGAAVLGARSTLLFLLLGRRGILHALLQAGAVLAARLAQVEDAGDAGEDEEGEAGVAPAVAHGLDERVDDGGGDGGTDIAQKTGEGDHARGVRRRRLGEVGGAGDEDPGHAESGWLAHEC